MLIYRNHESLRETSASFLLSSFRNEHVALKYIWDSRGPRGLGSYGHRRKRPLHTQREDVKMRGGGHRQKHREGSIDKNREAAVGEGLQRVGPVVETVQKLLFKP